MYRVLLTCLFRASLLWATASAAVSPVHKCEKDGSVTYQNNPCPHGGRAPQPTVQQLNAERRQRAAAAPSAALTSAGTIEADARPAQPAGAVQQEARSPFRCDGRTLCSQMGSCAEAQYFLAHCPGVKMDGDRNGIPCERQWCSR